MEEWRTVPGYPNYQVSNLGNVRGPKGPKKRVVGNANHVQMTLWHNNKAKTMSVNRIVCLAFHADTYFEGAHALHKNHIPDDCRAENLYWGTHKKNMQDMVEADRTGRSKGEKHGMAKLDWAKVKDIRARYAAGETQIALAKVFGVHNTQISNIVRNKSWKDKAYE